MATLYTMLIAVASPGPASNTMLPAQMGACSDLGFWVRLFTKSLKLQFSQEKERKRETNARIVISLTPLYDAISDTLAAQRGGLVPIAPIGDKPQDSHTLLNN